MTTYRTKLGAYVAFVFETFPIYLAGLFKKSKTEQKFVLIVKACMEGCLIALAIKDTTSGAVIKLVKQIITPFGSLRRIMSVNSTALVAEYI